MPSTAEVREIVIQELVALLDEGGIPKPDLQDDTVLLDTGLDSLGFAVLVTRLEDSLGYDPFTEMDEPVYPQTLGELVAIYSRFASSPDA